jgi:RNase H-like domain found in reverse transcriptase
MEIFLEKLRGQPTKKGVRRLETKINVDWDTERKKGFLELVQAMQAERNFAFVSQDDKFIMVTDASNHSIGGCLIRNTGKGEKNKESPQEIIKMGEIIRLFSKTLKKAERNYSTIEQELLAIIIAIVDNKHLINTSRHDLEIYCDHTNLESIRKFKKMRSRHVKWFEVLSDVKNTIKYITGKENELADYLSRPNMKEAKSESTILSYEGKFL